MFLNFFSSQPNPSDVWKIMKTLFVNNMQGKCRFPLTFLTFTHPSLPLFSFVFVVCE